MFVPNPRHKPPGRRELYGARYVGANRAFTKSLHAHLPLCKCKCCKYFLSICEFWHGVLLRNIRQAVWPAPDSAGARLRGRNPVGNKIHRKCFICQTHSAGAVHKCSTWNGCAVSKKHKSVAEHKYFRYTCGVTRQIKVALSLNPMEHAAISKAARAAGLSLAGYLRTSALAAVGGATRWKLDTTMNCESDGSVPLRGIAKPLIPFSSPAGRMEPEDIVGARMGKE